MCGLDVNQAGSSPGGSVCLEGKDIIRASWKGAGLIDIHKKTEPFASFLTSHQSFPTLLYQSSMPWPIFPWPFVLPIVLRNLVYLCF